MVEKTVTTCQHENFFADVSVARLTDKDDGPVTGYSAHVHIKCSQCGLPFRFLGLSAGSHFAEPRVSVDATELRAPLEPAHVVEICGMPLVAGRA